uniref:Eukaryotic translation initiation factor 4E family member 1B n=1 Tax=Mus musculus TaxID=10090 RepID=Q27ZI6_MOUSE|nr:oocyte-specific eukaryotic translation initiation factor 4E-like isoform 7 [Mus musculus]
MATSEVVSLPHPPFPEQLSSWGEKSGHQRVSLCNPGCPGSHSLDPAGLELKRSACLCLLSAGIKGGWVLWFFKNDRSRAWQDNLQLVTKFNTVEDFWAKASCPCGKTTETSRVAAGCSALTNNCATSNWTVCGWRRCCVWLGIVLRNTAGKCAVLS